MKKVLRYVITAAVIFVIAFLYAHVNKNISIYDKSVDTSLYGNMGVLGKGLCVRQEFVCNKDVLDGVSIKCGTIGESVTAAYQYQILDGTSEEILRQGTVEGAEVKNSKYYTIKFDQIKESKNKKFIFTFQSENASFDNALTIYNVPKGEEKADLYLNSDEFVNNTLALRTVSHIFDIETFISVSFCLAYLYIFIKILFRFFS